MAPSGAVVTVLMVAEKPSLAASIADILSGGKVRLVIRWLQVVGAAHMDHLPVARGMHAPAVYEPAWRAGCA